MRPRNQPSQLRGVRSMLGAIGLAVVLAVGVAACGSSSDSSAPEPALDAQATQGKALWVSKGCISCHTTSGNQSEGPTWKGLYGSQVTLADGTKVTADDAYLKRSITDPSAQIVAGFNSRMPTVALTDAEVAAIIAYIKALK